MPSRIINEICERVRNMPKMAFILDTSFVFGIGSEHTANYLDVTCGVWRNTVSITGVRVLCDGANSIFATGTSFFLYGIL